MIDAAMLDGPLLARVTAPARLMLVGLNSSSETASIESVLREDGYCLVGAADVDAASAAISLCHPSLIVLDLVPGDATGYTWMRSLKANPATSQIPVFVVSAATDSSRVLDALKAGADVFLMQPHDPDELLLRVRNLLRLTGAPLPRDVEAVAQGSDNAGGLISAAANRVTDGELQGAILDALPVTVALIDRQGIVVSVNRAWRNFADLNGMAAAYNFGINSNYLAICELACLSPKDRSEDVAGGIRMVLSGAVTNFSIEYPCHTEQQRWFLMTVSPLGAGAEGAVVMHLDVTQKYIAEQSLRDSEAQFRQMANNIRDVFFLADAITGRVLYVSPAYEEIFGRSCASLYADSYSWTSAMFPDERALIAASYAKHRQSSNARFDCFFQVVRPDQEVRWISMKVFSIRDADGVVTRIVGVAQDITESKEAVRDLRESEQRFHELLNNTSLLSVMLDLDGNVTFCNEALLRLTGRQLEITIGADWFATFMATDHARAREHFLDLLSDSPASLRYEDEIVGVNGERHLICWNSSVLHGHNGNVIGTASIGEDITEQRKSATKILSLNTNLEKMASQVLHAQEQERISLARELHDDLGQRLALLKINLHHLRRFLSDPDAHAAWAVLDAAVLTLIAQIRVISVSLRPPLLDYLGLESALEQLLNMQFSTGVCSYVFEYAGLPNKLAAPIETAVYRIVQESITNVVRHAHANVVVVEVNGGEAGLELELIIRDNGVGFPHAAGPEVHRADGSQGGLRGMHERVELLGGTFNVESSANAGTRVIVALPLKAQ